MSPLGEIRSVDSDYVPALLRKTDCILIMSDSETSYAWELSKITALQWACWVDDSLRVGARCGRWAKGNASGALKSHYVYCRKYNNDSSIKKYKARLVALGYGQVFGVDVFNTFVKCITVNLILAHAFIFNMQLEISNAFWYTNIEGDMSMQPTPDFAFPTRALRCHRLLSLRRL